VTARRDVDDHRDGETAKQKQQCQPHQTRSTRRRRRYSARPRTAKAVAVRAKLP
jgi:hypothetical protein